MFYPCNPKDGSIVKKESTANGYGHWFNASGSVSDWASGYVYSEMNASSLTFTLGQYPGKCKNGNDYTISQALVYKKSATEQATARFVFRIHLAAGQKSYELAAIDYNAPTAINENVKVNSEKWVAATGWYTLQGHLLNGKPTAKGVYINCGKKVVIK
jgi:hypothetical protein